MASYTGMVTISLARIASELAKCGYIATKHVSYHLARFIIVLVRIIPLTRYREYELILTGTRSQAIAIVSGLPLKNS